MGANNLSLTSSEDLRTLSKTFGDYSTTLADLLTNIKASVGDLQNVWSGEAATEFVDNISGTYETFEAAVSYLETVSTNLTTAASNYDEAESSNKGQGSAT